MEKRFTSSNKRIVEFCNLMESVKLKHMIDARILILEDAKEIQGMLDELDYVLDNCTLMEKKQETDIELEEEMEDIEK